jgi:hypothetical protein
MMQQTRIIKVGPLSVWVGFDEGESRTVGLVLTPLNRIAIGVDLTLSFYFSQISVSISKDRG